MRVEHQIDITRPIDEVFAFICTPENNEQWMNQILSTEHLTGEPMQAGSTWRHTVRTLGRTYNVVFELTAVMSFRSSFPWMSRYCLISRAGVYQRHAFQDQYVAPTARPSRAGGSSAWDR